MSKHEDRKLREKLSQLRQKTTLPAPSDNGVCAVFIVLSCSNVTPATPFAAQMSDYQSQTTTEPNHSC